jgi:hypothetical protein
MWLIRYPLYMAYTRRRKTDIHTLVMPMLMLVIGSSDYD